MSAPSNSAYPEVLSLVPLPTHRFAKPCRQMVSPHTPASGAVCAVLEASGAIGEECRASMLALVLRGGVPPAQHLLTVPIAAPILSTSPRVGLPVARTRRRVPVPVPNLAPMGFRGLRLHVRDSTFFTDMSGLRFGPGPGKGTLRCGPSRCGLVPSAGGSLLPLLPP